MDDLRGVAGQSLTINGGKRVSCHHHRPTLTSMVLVSGSCEHDEDGRLGNEIKGIRSLIMWCREFTNCQYVEGRPSVAFFLLIV